MGETRPNGEPPIAGPFHQSQKGDCTVFVEHQNGPIELKCVLLVSRPGVLPFGSPESLSWRLVSVAEPYKAFFEAALVWCRRKLAIPKARIEDCALVILFIRRTSLLKQLIQDDSTIFSNINAAAYCST
ncbi:hypothetical protein An01g10780 [Aspergillus niger]|uniref:Uncharacterized protein n=2 Tax=Aspergillus niger TaxID=5061 RepID=A2QAA6_ASPNC|nr:hypothetical protein An01g10780 [Aspergillus niger]CAK37258.1 hypothetical protein An01g10780 [Aspergillus niger]